MITNQLQAQALLPKLSQQQLMQLLQSNDGTVPTYAVMAELQARQQRATGFAGPQAPQTSVRQDMVNKLAANNGGTGIASLARQTMPPPNAAPVQPGIGAPMGPGAATPAGPAAGAGPGPGMAKGGKVNFDDGGQVPYDADDPYSGLPQNSSYWDQMKNALSFMTSPPSGSGKIPAAAIAAAKKVVSYPTGPAATPASPQSPGYGNQMFPVAAGPSYSSGPQGLAAFNQAAQAASAPGANVPMPAAGGSVSFGVRAPGMGGLRPEIPAFVPTPVTMPSMDEVMKGFPLDTSAQDQMANIQAGDHSASDLQNAKWEALMRAGIGMASTPGPMLSALAHGAGQGLDSLTANRHMIQQQQQANQKNLSDLAIAQGVARDRAYMAARNAAYQQAEVANMGNTAGLHANQIAAEQRSSTNRDLTQMADTNARVAMGNQQNQQYKMLNLLQQARERAGPEFDKMPGAAMLQMQNPAEYARQREGYVARAIQTVPGWQQYYQAPAAPQGGGFLQSLPQGAQIRN